jgi:predicted nucleotidyltransferase component of viral defense system
MSNDEIKNLAASVHQKLLNKAHETNRPFNELLQYYAIERFLYRLSRSPFVKKFVLKGALLLNVWGISGYRPTRDIDFLGNTPDSLEKIVSIFQQICAIDVGLDGMKFDVESIQGEHINEDADYEGVRVTFSGSLGKARVPMQIEIGFADIVTPGPVSMDYPVLLDFPAPNLNCYPHETLIAEKLQAMVSLGEINSRMKDFYDICILALQLDFDGEVLQRAIEKTFEQRGTSLPEEIPVALTDDFARQKTSTWDAFIKRTGLQQPDRDFLQVVRLLQKFLMPLLHASVTRQNFRVVWKKGKWVDQ